MDFSSLDLWSLYGKLKAAWPVLAFVGSGILLVVRNSVLPRSRRMQAAIGFGAFALFAVALVGGYLATRPERATGSFAILVADLDGDTERSQTRHILNSLRTQFGEDYAKRGLQILPRGEALVAKAGDLQKVEEPLKTKGREWLVEQNASVLIWGEAAARDELLRLRFLSAEEDGTAKPYALSEQTLELPQDFGADLGAVLAAQAATAISPVYDRDGEALAALLSPIVAKLKLLAENPPASFADETRVKLWQAYAAGADRLGDNSRLATAIAFFKRVLTARARDKAALDWAMTQNNLGNALARLGERESGTARLEEAVAAFREALKEYARERVPLDWATTQINLGNALQALGERESGTARLEEAVAAYREALKEYTRERVPLDWAMTQNNLGNALRALGERESGTARLEEAVAAYRAALEECTRERVPLDWATTQNNLGNALRALGERESGTARLEEAVAAYRAALEEWTRERVPLDWAMTQNNLGNALADARRARERDGAAGGGRRRLSRGAGGMYARARAARLGGDAEQPRQRASDARRARERDGAAGRGRRRLSRGAGGKDARARAARLGDDAEQSRQCAFERSASARAGRRGWKRPSPPIARR